MYVTCSLILVSKSRHDLTSSQGVLAHAENLYPHIRCGVQQPFHLYRYHKNIITDVAVQHFLGRELITCLLFKRCFKRCFKRWLWWETLSMTYNFVLQQCGMYTSNCHTGMHSCGMCYWIRLYTSSAIIKMNYLCSSICVNDRLCLQHTVDIDSYALWASDEATMPH